MAQQLPTLDAAALTDIGLKRQKNEDSFALQIPPQGNPLAARGALFVVADGMGGMGGGDIASQTAVQILMKEYYSSANPDLMAALRAAIEAANVAVRDKAAEANRPRIGSTAAGLLLLPDGEGMWFNVGDARVYRVRQGLIEQVSHDQSVLQHQLDAGFISEEDARIARNVNVTMFIGQPNPVQPVYRRGQTQPGDIFVLCSDGLWDLVESSEILQIVQKMPAQDATRKLVDLARKRGAPDNVTVIVVRLGAKPQRRSRGLVLGALALIAVAAIGTAIVLLSQGNDAKNSTPTPTTPAVAVVPGLPSETVTATAIPSDTPQGSAPTAAAVFNIHTLTFTPTLPSATPSLTATTTLTATASVTRTPTTTRTPTPTPLPSATATDTATPTSTGTASVTRTPTTTALPPTDTPPPTPTTRASDTPVKPPTVTLNPTIITWTPSPRPSPTPTLSPEQQILMFASQESVQLKEPTTLYFLYTLTEPTTTETLTPGIPQVIETVTLEAGTQVIVRSDVEQPHPEHPELILREVEVKTGLERGKTGWIDREVLANSDLVVPRVIVIAPKGLNVRAGDSTLFPTVGQLASGEMAKVLGISSGGSGWYQIQMNNGVIGWVAPGYVELIGAAVLERITPPVPPTLTFTPEAPVVTEATATENPSVPAAPTSAPPPTSSGGGSTNN